jgi:hypothetical protein
VAAASGAVSCAWQTVRGATSSKDPYGELARQRRPNADAYQISKVRNVEDDRRLLPADIRYRILVLKVEYPARAKALYFCSRMVVATRETRATR